MTESLRWARRPRCAPRTRWDLQDSQYRDWKFSTCTAWVLISAWSSLVCAESGEKGLTRRKLLHNHHNVVLVLSHQFLHLFLNMGHTQETKVSSTGSSHTRPRNHFRDMPSIPLGQRPLVQCTLGITAHFCSKSSI